MEEKVKKFLQRLLAYGLEKEIFMVKAIAQLEKSCCTNSGIKVIDFDRTKEMICKEKGFQLLKSCDALKIIPLSGHLHFIEMKGFKKFIEHRFDPEIVVEKQIHKQIVSFDIVKKIRHSVFLLNTIVNLQEFDVTSEERGIFDTIPKQFIIVVDIEMEEKPLEMLAVNLAYLSETSTPLEKQISAIMETELENIPSSIFDNTAKPRLMNCRSIDEYYEAIENHL